jgi:predicted metal-dependent HD superfamily phosphohydrolase
MSKKENKQLPEQEIENIARSIKDTSQKINPTRPSDIFVPLLQNYSVEDRKRIRTKIEEMLKETPTLGYLINNNQATHFNKWLGAVRDTRVGDLKREASHWTEAFVSAMDLDQKNFDKNDE